MSRDQWETLACDLEAAASFARRKGADIEQKFFEWQRVGRIPRTQPPCPVCDGIGCEDCHGTGNAPSIRSESEDDRDAQRQLHLYRLCLADLENRLQRFRSFEAVAFPKAKDRLEARHQTAAQVEVDGGCGSCWRVGVFWHVETRPSGEPFYRGRCRFCGSWPDGDPPLEAVQAKRGDRIIRRRAAS